jgi:hypothetical protein
MQCGVPGSRIASDPVFVVLSDLALPRGPELCKPSKIKSAGRAKGRCGGSRFKLNNILTEIDLRFNTILQQVSQTRGKPPWRKSLARIGFTYWDCTVLNQETFSKPLGDDE